MDVFEVSISLSVGGERPKTQVELNEQRTVHASTPKVCNAAQVLPSNDLNPELLLLGLLSA